MDTYTERLAIAARQREYEPDFVQEDELLNTLTGAQIAARLKEGASITWEVFFKRYVNPVIYFPKSDSKVARWINDKKFWDSIPEQPSEPGQSVNCESGNAGSNRRDPDKKSSRKHRVNIGRIREIRRNRNLSDWEVYDMVYDKLITEKKLDLYRGKDDERCEKCGHRKSFDFVGDDDEYCKECERRTFFSFILQYINEVVLGYHRKNDIPESEDPAKPPYNGESTTSSTDKDWEVAQKCFTELWRRNSMAAYVHLLKTKFEMSSSAISNLLGIASANYVDKIASNARNTMRELRSEYENN